MEDLLQSQIKESCKLALPEGLKDLMSDISREVLRARPQNLYQFIADYLAAMLVARDTLTIAGHVCKGVCDCSCKPELEDELRNIELTQEEVDEAKKIIIQYLEKDKVKEESLMAKLLRTNIDPQKLPDIQKAVKAAYKRNLLRHKYFDVSSDDVTRAAKNTLELYLKPASPDSNQADSYEEQPPFYNAEQKYKTEASSSNSSQCMFKDIVYDGGVKDLYVSNNCKPYKNSSLMSLAGSYGIPLVCKGQTNTTELIIQDNENGNTKVKHKNADKKVHIDFIEVKKDKDLNTIGEEIIRNDKFESGDEKLEVDDEVVDADDESDISITEDIDED